LLRQRIHDVRGTRRSRAIVTSDTSLVNPWRIPARFEMKKMFCASMLSRTGAMIGIVNVGKESTGGETVLSPPTGGKKMPER
jgi:hypothetical protein